MFKHAPRPYRTPSIDFDTPTRTRIDTGRSLREELSKDGVAFVTQMAGKAILTHTAAEFPHVVNKLARFSYQPPLMLKAIDAVLIDDRPSRQGFPFEVVMELGKLRELYGHYVAAGV